MTTHELTAAIERLMEADRLRTEGRWQFDGDGWDSDAARLCGTEGYSVFPIDEEDTCVGFIADVDDEMDAKFIALSSQSPQLIWQLLAVIGQMGEAAKKVSHHYMFAIAAAGAGQTIRNDFIRLADSLTDAAPLLALAKKQEGK